MELNTSKVLRATLSTVGSDLVPTWTFPSTDRLSYLISIFGIVIPTLYDQNWQKKVRKKKSVAINNHLMTASITSSTNPSNTTLTMEAATTKGKNIKDTKYDDNDR